jgi:hypothetical protein
MNKIILTQVFFIICLANFSGHFMSVIQTAKNIVVLLHHLAKLPLADLRLLLFRIERRWHCYCVNSLRIQILPSRKSVCPTLPGSVARAGKRVDCVPPFVSREAELITRLRASPSSALPQKNHRVGWVVLVGGCVRGSDSIVPLLINSRTRSTRICRASGV